MVIYYFDLDDIRIMHDTLDPPPRAMGFLYRGGVEFMVDEVKNTFETLSEHDAIIGKAAYLWHTLAFNQYFADGNKRTGFVVADTFLRINGINFTTNVDYKHGISTGISLGAYDTDTVRILITQSLK